MSVKREIYDGVGVVGVEGELADEAAAEAREAVRDHLERRQVRDVVLDLTHCTAVASAGLEALLWAKLRCEEYGGRLKLAGCDEFLLKVLEMTRLRHRFECGDTLESALKSMRV